MNIKPYGSKKIIKKDSDKFCSINEHSVLVYTIIDKTSEYKTDQVDELMDTQKSFYWTE
jgi:hypothetical protein